VPNSLTWVVAALLVWAVLSAVIGLFVARFFRLSAASLAAADDEAAEAASAASRATLIEAPSFLLGERQRLRSRRVLVVDDDPALRTLLHTTLAADEFEVAEAEDAERAFDLVRLWRPALVLLDVGMPGVDGLAFCAELKRNPPEGGRAPLVVLLTGLDINEEEARRAGADALLWKPFSPLELVGVVDRLTGTEAAELRTEVGDVANEQILSTPAISDASSSSSGFTGA
jgi:CheY-like chemotaxis protein